MTHATHFYNAMPVVYKNREFKVPGTVESIFALQDMTVEMIADGIHVPPVMLRMIYQIKGVEKTALITDSLACAATEGLIRTCVQQANIPMEDACRMASETPAKIMGVFDRKGSLEAGKDADLMMFDNDLKLTYVMQMGNEVTNEL